MDYARQQRDPTKHAIGIVFVVGMHLLLIWALLSGLGKAVVEVIKKPLTATIVEQIKAPPPPPPPPKKIELPKPAPPQETYVPPPDIPVPTTEAPVITAVTPTPPPPDALRDRTAGGRAARTAAAPAETGDPQEPEAAVGRAPRVSACGHSSRHRKWARRGAVDDR